MALQDSIVELRDSVRAFKEPARDIPEWPDTEALERQPPDEPVSPELVLVAPPRLAAAARRQLPEPEPLDAWVARMRYAELERDWRAFEQTVQECGERETLSSGFGAIAFAVVTTILSALPVLAFVLA